MWRTFFNVSSIVSWLVMTSFSFLFFFSSFLFSSFLTSGVCWVLWDLWVYNFHWIWNIFQIFFLSSPLFGDSITHINWLEVFWYYVFNLFFFLCFILDNSNCFFFFFFFMAVLGLRFCARAFSSCGKWGPLFIAVRGPLTAAGSLVVEHRLQTRRLSSCGAWA